MSNYAPIDYNEIFSLPDFQNRIKLVVSFENDKFDVQVTTAVLVIVSYFDNYNLVDFMISDAEDELVIEPIKDYEDEHLYSERLEQDYAGGDYYHLVSPLVREYLRERFKNKTVKRWEIKGAWDSYHEFITFHLNDAVGV